jgi:hypothetical protein
MVKRSGRDCQAPCESDAGDTVLFADLVATLRIWPWDIAAMRQCGPSQLAVLVEVALARTRRDGLAGHWAYDLNRHRKLVDLRRRLDATAARMGTHGGARLAAHIRVQSV